MDELPTKSWFDGRPITFLYTDGFKDFYGVRSELGDVVSRVQLRPSDDINRKASIEHTSINTLMNILEGGDNNGNNT